MKSITRERAQARKRAEPTIRDVAERAGVSAATVSRVLNGADNVGPAGRERVQAAISELGYQPNRLARNLRRQQAQMLGVVVTDIENPHFAETVRAIEDATYRRGYRVLLCNTDEDPEKQRAYLQLLIAERVAGVILAPSDPVADEVGQLIDLGIAVVALDRRVADPRADSVFADSEAAARTATEHLRALGHHRIALVGGPPGIETAAARQRGYERAMTAAGLEPRIADGGFRREAGRAATAGLLACEPGPTALLFANNLMAVGGLEALRAHGRSVPGDISVVSIDDPIWAALVDPPLTTLRQPVREMADGAVALLFERLAGRRRKPRERVFPLRLIARESSGPAQEGA